MDDLLHSHRSWVWMNGYVNDLHKRFNAVHPVKDWTATVQDKGSRERVFLDMQEGNLPSLS